MQLTLSLEIPPLPVRVKYEESILLIGSCFTEHISEKLAAHKFRVLSNPNGNLFNPLSVCESLRGYISGKRYTEDDLFYLNELWNSWDHHTQFSNIDKQAALDNINASQSAASEFIKNADWIFITLGSAFQYFLNERSPFPGNRTVSNNHRGRAQWFEKRLLTSDEIVESLRAMMAELFAVNPKARVIYTISPVRHIRDGVVENNRSKARLIEAVHTLCNASDKTFYFPAYELVIDILRDYRFYDIDFVHPNYLATSFVWEQFVKTAMSPETKAIMKEVQDIMIAKSHRPRFAQTEAHQKFMKDYAYKTKELMKRFPFLQLEEELKYFGG